MYWRNILSNKLLKSDAINIARKLGAKIEKDGAHQIASFFYEGIFIFEFGIRHGSKSTHGHLCGENKVLHLSESNALSFSRCHITMNEYVRILREKGVIPEAAP
jgi:hypothetical protein